MLAAAIFGGTYALLWREQVRALNAAAGLADGGVEEQGAVPPSAEELARSIRAMKLVTVEVQTTVRSEVSDTSWRGDVAATVAAPARLLYGCDLSTLGVDGGEAGGQGAWLRPNLLSGGYTLRVPRPRRIASEVYGELERTNVSVGWGRFRDLAGEQQLGLARSALQQQARKMPLTPEQREEMERTTREQLGALVRGFAGAVGGGRDVAVAVEFFEPEVAEAGQDAGSESRPTQSRPTTAAGEP